MIKRWFTTLLNDNCLIRSNNYIERTYIDRHRLFCMLLAVYSFLFINSASSSAQSQTPLVSDTLKVTIHISFQEGSAQLLPNYQSNQAELGKIDDLLRQVSSDGTHTLERLVIVGFASPEGLYTRNNTLARQRTEQLKKYISAHQGISPKRIVTRHEAEDWKGLIAFVEQTTKAQMPNRDKVLEVARSNMDPDEKERIISTEYPNEFYYLLVHCMPTLRRTEWCLEYRINRQTHKPVATQAPQPTTTNQPTTDNQPTETEANQPTTTTTDDQPAEPESNEVTEAEQPKELEQEEPTPAEAEAEAEAEPEEERPFYWMVKTNLLYDLGATPNVGVEVSIGHRWTVAAEWLYAWWKSDRRHRYWQGYGGYLSVRRYFGPSAEDHPFTGHHIGAYGTALTYDVEWGGRGYQAARYGFGGGLEYGYSIALAHRLNLDFSLGLGFQDGEYKVYDPKDSHYVWQSTHKRHWWGPTKADISLVWLLGRSNKKKGGQL